MLPSLDEWVGPLEVLFSIGEERRNTQGHNACVLDAFNAVHIPI